MRKREYVRGEYMMWVFAILNQGNGRKKEQGLGRREMKKIIESRTGLDLIRLNWIGLALRKADMTGYRRRGRKIREVVDLE